MKKLKITLLVLAIGAFMVLAQQSCQSDNSTEEVGTELVHHEKEYHSLLEQVYAESLDSIHYNLENKYIAADLPYVNAEANLKGKKAFFVESVKGKLNYYPCSNCHSQPLAQLQKSLKNGFQINL